MTRMKISVPRTAPAILFHSQESIRSLRLGPLECGPTLPTGEEHSLRRSVAEFKEFKGFDETDRADPRPHGLHPIARQAAGRHRGQADDRARLGTGDG